MPEPQALAHVSAGEAEASMTCPVCKGAGTLRGRSLGWKGQSLPEGRAEHVIECNKCGGAGQVPAEPDVNAELLAALRDMLKFMQGQDMKITSEAMAERVSDLIQRAEAQR